MQADVALLTERRYTGTRAAADDWYLANILHDDGLLRAALAERGLSSVRVDWSDPRVDWSAFGWAVFRTTWDYFDRFAEFTAWLDRVEPLTRWCNAAALIRWNWDKHYLADLAARGVSVVESRFIERGSAVCLRELLAATGWAEAVVKPCISGAARHTYRLHRDDPDTLQAVNRIVGQLLATESLIVQPFQRQVVERGEDSLVVIAGRFTHAVRKLAKPGDFRVQDDHGGTVHPHQPTPRQIALAEHAVSVCRPAPVYARVDMIVDNHGRDAIMELELIEPELWLRLHPPAATALAAAIAARA
jgi:glutathione synthase/RimK-type ligase-like ATP-grasp enzyme